MGPGGDVKLVAEVKGSGHNPERARQQASRYAAMLNAPWAMVATPQQVQLFRWRVGTTLEEVDSLPMSRLVERYGRQNERGLYFESYVRTMLELWLRDLTLHWKAAQGPPPTIGPEEFENAVRKGTLLVEP